MEKEKEKEKEMMWNQPTYRYEILDEGRGGCNNKDHVEFLFSIYQKKKSERTVAFGFDCVPEKDAKKKKREITERLEHLTYQLRSGKMTRQEVINKIM